MRMVRPSVVGMSVCLIMGCSGTNRLPSSREPVASPALGMRSDDGGSSTPRPSASSSRPPGGGSKVASGSEGEFAVARQVAALERSIELYEAFIERAGDDPGYAEAVRRSHDRITDAKHTICFLLDEPCTPEPP